MFRIKEISLVAEDFTQDPVTFLNLRRYAEEHKRGEVSLLWLFGIEQPVAKNSHEKYPYPRASNAAAGGMLLQTTLPKLQPLTDLDWQQCQRGVYPAIKPLVTSWLYLINFHCSSRSFSANNLPPKVTYWEKRLKSSLLFKLTQARYSHATFTTSKV